MLEPSQPDGGEQVRRIRLFLCLQLELFNQSLSIALQQQNAVEVVGTARQDAGAPDRMERSRPDVVLFSTEPTPHGWRFFEALQDLQRSMRLLAIGPPDMTHAARLLRAGVKGYLYPGTRIDHLVRAIRSVQQGELWADRRLTALAIGGYPRHASSGLHLLSRQEKHVLRLLAAGKRNKDIAGELTIEESTVKSHLCRIYKKLGVSDRIQAVLFITRNGLDELNITAA